MFFELLKAEFLLNPIKFFWGALNIELPTRAGFHTWIKKQATASAGTARSLRTSTTAAEAKRLQLRDYHGTCLAIRRDITAVEPRPVSKPLSKPASMPAPLHESTSAPLHEPMLALLHEPTPAPEPQHAGIHVRVCSCPSTEVRVCGCPSTEVRVCSCLRTLVKVCGCPCTKVQVCGCPYSKVRICGCPSTKV